MMTRPFLSILWRYRVPLAGLSALLFALLGEQLMRPPGPNIASPSAELGSHLVQLAALLVGLAAWVRNDFRLPWRRKGNTPSQQAATAETLPTRRIQRDVVASNADTQANLEHGVWRGLSRLATRYTEVRSRLGWKGTAAGLIITGVLTALLYFLLRQDFTHPLAPWVWLATLLVVLLTFVGVRPRPAGDPMLAHDSAEPESEPPVDRREWVIIGLIMLAAVVLRLWNLGSVPAGPYIDESGRALDARAINLGLPFNHGQFVFFGTGWWGIPSLYFWVVAQSLKVFGDNLFGARMIHAIAGIATVWYTYRAGRVVWSPRAGLIAGALIAACDFAIQFSRTAGESTFALFTWTACFYYLLKGMKSRRPPDFALSGLAGGLTLYGYASGKLLPIFVALAALYLLVRWGLQGAKRYLPGLALLALVAGLTYLPNALFILVEKPGALTERSQGVSIFSPQNREAAAKTYGTDNMGLILARQFATTYSAFDVGQEHGPFYPTGQPVLPVPWAALWVLGTAYMVWRIGDARYGVLAVWVMSGLAGAALTNDTPTLQRVVGMVPTLGLVPALFLDRVASGVTGWNWNTWRLPRARVLRWATNAAVAAIVLYSAAQAVQFYFGPYTAQARYSEFTLAGSYAAGLDPRRDMVYQADVPIMNGDTSPTLFQSKDINVADLVNVGDVLPVVANGHKSVHFLISKSAEQYTPLIQAYYPDATKTQISTSAGTPIFSAYKVSAEQIDAQRYVMAHYGPAAGPLYERQEARLGTLGPPDSSETISPPAWITYPTTAEWVGGVVAPAYGTYRLALTTPAGGALEVDGRKLITTSPGNTEGTETRLVLAKGLHRVRLTGGLDSAQGRVELRWGTDNGVLFPVGRQFLWGGPQGTLLAESYPASNEVWLTSQQLPTNALTSQFARRDGSVAIRSLRDALGVGPGMFATWRGTLNLPADGSYLFDAAGPDQLSLWIDGKIAGARGLPDVQAGLPATVALASGRHTFEVRCSSRQDNSELNVFWQPPGGQRELLPPSALAPADGGAWTAEQHPGVPSPDAALISLVSEVSVNVEGTISEGGTWKDAIGVAVLADGRVVVGDTGNHRILFYGADGRQMAAWNGTEADGFNDLSDVAVSSDGVIAALDAENADIRLFTPDGQQTAHLPREKLGLTHARGLAWGPDGKMYVADTAGGRVVRITRDGQQEANYNQGTGSVQAIDQPIDVAVAPDGTVYAVDLRGRVVRFNATGQADRDWKVPIGVTHGGSHVALWGDQIAVTNPDANNVMLVDPTKGATSQLSISGASPLGLLAPGGVAAGPDGRLYVLDSGNKRVLMLGRAR